MKKITIEYDEDDTMSDVLYAAERALNSGSAHMKHDQNVKVNLDKGFKTGVITQKGVCVPFMERSGRD